MFKQVMKKIGVIVLALTLLILDLTLLGAFPLLTQDGKFSLMEQIGYGIWALGSLAIFIVIAYRFKLLSLKEINWRRLVAIACDYGKSRCFKCYLCPRTILSLPSSRRFYYSDYGRNHF